MKLSIIIPTYNSEKYLEQTLKSINDQNLDNSVFEVVFIDGFSSDNTISIINNFQNLHNIKGARTQ